MKLILDLCLVNDCFYRSVLFFRKLTSFCLSLVDEYYKMPPMHRQDDFERCLWSKRELATYCTVATLVKPDETNAVWNQIEEFSSKTKIHFSHDLIFSGQCLSECQKRMSAFTEEELVELYVEEFPYRFNRSVIGVANKSLKVKVIILFYFFSTHTT